jgi:hypothetical protein
LNITRFSCRVGFGFSPSVREIVPGEMSEVKLSHQAGTFSYFY